MLNKLYFDVNRPHGLPEICFKTSDFALSGRLIFFYRAIIFSENPEKKASDIPTSDFKTVLHWDNIRALDTCRSFTILAGKFKFITGNGEKCEK